MADYGHEETDRLIKELEEKLKKEYKTAQKDLEKKLEKHLEKYQKQLTKKEKELADGKISQQSFDFWKSKEIAGTIHWKNMIDTISTDLLNADKIAAQMINNEELTAFALNHNFATYEIEKGLNINTSYELVDRETVKNLVKNNPDLLKDVKIDTDKTTRWNKKKINSVILQGTIQGESIPQIAKRLQEVTQSNYKIAVRNARTAMTYAQNSGRMQSYYRAEKLGVKMKKAWLATLDGRTRHEHRMLDGQVVGIHESFEVDGEKLECPGDPKASYHLTMNCRCTLVGELEGFEDDFSDLAQRNTRHMTENTYEEWKHAKEKQAAKNSLKEAKNEMSFSEKIKQIKDRVSQSGLSEDDLLEAGKIVSKEVNNLYGENIKFNAQEMNKLSSEYSILKKDYQKIERKADKLQTEIWLDRWQKLGYATKKEAEAEYQKLIEILDAKRKSLNEVRKKYLELKDSVPRYYTSAENLKNILSNVREMGSSNFDIIAHLRNSKSKMAPIVKEAYSFYPTDWVKSSIDWGTLKVKKTSRGYYDDYNGEIAISGLNKNGWFEAAIHELGHRYERTVPDIRKMEKNFYNRRTAGENLEWLGAGFSKDEKAKKDNFLDAYMGKSYGGSAYELVSMGFEYAYTDPMKLAQDPDMEAWIYGILCLM